MTQHWDSKNLSQQVNLTRNATDTTAPAWFSAASHTAETAAVRQGREANNGTGSSLTALSADASSNIPQQSPVSFSLALGSHTVEFNPQSQQEAPAPLPLTLGSYPVEYNTQSQQETLAPAPLTVGSSTLEQNLQAPTRGSFNLNVTQHVPYPSNQGPSQPQPSTATPHIAFGNASTIQPPAWASPSFVPATVPSLVTVEPLAFDSRLPRAIAYSTSPPGAPLLPYQNTRAQAPSRPVAAPSSRRIAQAPQDIPLVDSDNEDELFGDLYVEVNPSALPARAAPFVPRRAISGLPPPAPSVDSLRPSPARHVAQALGFAPAQEATRSSVARYRETTNEESESDKDETQSNKSEDSDDGDDSDIFIDVDLGQLLMIRHDEATNETAFRGGDSNELDAVVNILGNVALDPEESEAVEPMDIVNQEEEMNTDNVLEIPGDIWHYRIEEYMKNAMENAMDTMPDNENLILNLHEVRNTPGDYYHDAIIDLVENAMDTMSEDEDDMINGDPPRDIPGDLFEGRIAEYMENSMDLGPDDESRILNINAVRNDIGDHFRDRFQQEELQFAALLGDIDYEIGEGETSLELCDIHDDPTAELLEGFNSLSLETHIQTCASDPEVQAAIEKQALHNMHLLMTVQEVPLINQENIPIFSDNEITALTINEFDATTATEQQYALPTLEGLYTAQDEIDFNIPLSSTMTDFTPGAEENFSFNGAPQQETLSNPTPQAVRFGETSTIGLHSISVDKAAEVGIPPISAPASEQNNFALNSTMPQNLTFGNDATGQQQALTENRGQQQEFENHGVEDGPAFNQQNVPPSEMELSHHWFRNDYLDLVDLGARYASEEVLQGTSHNEGFDFDRHMEGSSIDVQLDDMAGCEISHRVQSPPHQDYSNSDDETASDDQKNFICGSSSEADDSDEYQVSDAGDFEPAYGTRANTPDPKEGCIVPGLFNDSPRSSYSAPPFEWKAKPEPKGKPAPSESSESSDSDEDCTPGYLRRVIERALRDNEIEPAPNSMVPRMEADPVHQNRLRIRHSWAAENPGWLLTTLGARLLETSSQFAIDYCWQIVSRCKKIKAERQKDK